VYIIGKGPYLKADAPMILIDKFLAKVKRPVEEEE
jgi:hypothetical protein